ncbi:DUF397 domain-containing protein [Streptomyces sp. MUM 178J]|uniref:DUF397 domain-containing protein n=1 Tax=Streptomyces sp. MUM 178J TaxID=2791991 RepID=UPI001F0421B2|nr:DUF397 domain-containing protein [Streptomyces sp. MUM 178J]WRQ79636.1 DUF397 domain-containing protein [Streptomyces sp. MUM 178J]
MTTFHGVEFRTSSYSTDDCVSVAPTPGAIAVADTKTGHRYVVEISPSAWDAFLSGLTR